MTTKPKTKSEEKEASIITRKIELYVIGEKEEKEASWKFLRKINNDVFRAYNTVVSQQFFNDSFKERILKTDDELSEKNTELENAIEKITQEIKNCGKAEEKKDEKEKLIEKRKKLYKAQSSLSKEARIKSEQMYLTSEQNSTYQLLSDKFPDMPSSIRTCVNMDANKCYHNDLFDVQRGLKSIRSYKRDCPIPFQKSSMRFIVNAKNEIVMNWLGNVTFFLNFGRDKSNNREIIDRAMDGTYKYCDSKIQVDGKKVYLLFCVEIPNTKGKLDFTLSVGANLGLIVPAYCSLSKGKSRLAIGSADDLLRIRVQMKARYERLQMALRMAKGGRGRDEKLKAMDRLKKKEANYVKHYNHMVSSEIIKFALRNGAGVIKMELLEGYGDDDMNKFILRNWSYFQVHNFVEYKAKKVGMKVVYTDPFRISQTCNCCGVYDEANLETRNDFVCKNPDCKNYGVKVFSDYNASLNNAQSLRIVTKKEDCEYHKKYSDAVAE